MLHFVATMSSRTTSQRKLTRFRAEFNLTQQQLANLLDVARNTVARWEVGLVTVPKVALLALDGLRVQLTSRSRGHGRRRHKSTRSRT